MLEKFMLSRPYKESKSKYGFMLQLNKIKMNSEKRKLGKDLSKKGII